MIETVLLDANKTIEDSDELAKVRPNILKGMSQYLSESCGEVSSDFLEQLHSTFVKRFGQVMWEHHPVFWRTAISQITGDGYSEDLVRATYAKYLQVYESQIGLHNDVVPFLQKHRGNYRFGLVANGNGERISRLIESFNLKNYLGCFAVSGESLFNKPDPFLFEYALWKLGAKPDRTVMVGDRYSTDIAGARALGIRSAHLLRWSTISEGCGTPWICPDAEIRSLSELSSLLPYEPTTWPIYELNSDFTEKDIVRDALVMCGGRGRRMGNLATDVQKCLLPLGGVPILDYLIRTLSAVGCQRVFFVLGHHGAQVKEFVGDGSRFGIQADYVDGQFGCTLEATYHSLPLLSDKFYYVHANVIFPPRLLEALWRKFIGSGRSQLIVVSSEQNIHHARVKSDSEGHIMQLDASGHSSYNFGNLFLGVALYQKNLFSVRCDNRGPSMTEVALEKALTKGARVDALMYTGKWKHYETAKDYELDKEHTPAEIVRW